MRGARLSVRARHAGWLCTKGPTRHKRASTFTHPVGGLSRAWVLPVDPTADFIGVRREFSEAPVAVGSHKLQAVQADGPRMGGLGLFSGFFGLVGPGRSLAAACSWGIAVCKGGNPVSERERVEEGKHQGWEEHPLFLPLLKKERKGKKESRKDR